MDKKDLELLLISNQKEAEEYGKKLGINWRTVYWRRAELVKREKKKLLLLKENEENKKNEKDESIKKKILHHKQIAIKEIANAFDISPDHVKKLVDELIDEGHLIDITEENIKKIPIVEPSEPFKIDIEPFYNRWIKFGVVSDTHLNSKYERLDVLNALYDMFEREGVKNVFHAGNIIDGFSNLNMFDVINSGVNEQVEYCIKNYPQRKNIITHFITADDHEGWYVKREHVNIGKVIEQTAFEYNRNDLHHLGYIEADVKIPIGKRDTAIRIFHPGGGTAYAISYLPQKVIESLQGGDKPDFLIIGHLHKRNDGEVRNVPYVLAGCVQDQTPFMRKKHNEAHIGGYIVELEISEDGDIFRIKTEFNKFYNRKFYTEKKEYERFPENWKYNW